MQKKLIEKIDLTIAEFNKIKQTNDKRRAIELFNQISNEPKLTLYVFNGLEALGKHFKFDISKLSNITIIKPISSSAFNSQQKQLNVKAFQLWIMEQCKDRYLKQYQYDIVTS